MNKKMAQYRRLDYQSSQLEWQTKSSQSWQAQKTESSEDGSKLDATPNSPKCTFLG